MMASSNTITSNINLSPLRITHSDRVSFRYPTSDVLGSHTRDDLDSYLALVRRKIQEKYATVRDLIIGIHRLRSGGTGLVTPVEFRHTLIKLGILIPKEMSDRVFVVFDGDRSGCINFEDFSTWVMNSEFKSLRPKYDPNSLENKSDELLRIKLLKCANKYPECFTRLQKKNNFETFFNAVNRKFTRLTIPDAKRIFEMFDPYNTGYIEGTNMIKEAELGSKSEILGDNNHKNNFGDTDNSNNGMKNFNTSSTGLSNSGNWGNNSNKSSNSVHDNSSESNGMTTRTMTAEDFNNTNNNNTNSSNDFNRYNMDNNSEKNIKEAIENLCGHNSHLLEFCFSSSDKNKNKKVNFEIFIKLLKEGGLCHNMKNVRGLFLALGGQSGIANIDQLLKIVSVMIEERKILRLTLPSPASRLEEIENREATMKRAETKANRALHMDRKMREGMRHSYRTVRQAFEAADIDKTGFLDFETLYQIVNSVGCHMALSDFKALAKQLNTNNDGSKISWRHFMQSYSTRAAPHSLEGTGFSNLAISLRRKYFMTNPHLFSTIIEKPDAKDRPSHPIQRPVTSMGTRTARFDFSSGANSPVRCSSPDDRTFYGSLLGNDSMTFEDNKRSKSTGAISISGRTQGNLNSFDEGGLSGVSSLKRRVRASRNHVTQSLQGTLDPEHNHQLLANDKIVQAMKITKKADESEIDRDIRRSWTSFLKDCYQADPESLGYVSKEEFIAALNDESLRNILEGESKVSIAERFAVPDSDGRSVDYLKCFRAYLRQATVRFVPAVIQAERAMNNQMSSLSLSASAPQLSLTQAITHTYTPALHKEPSNRHPWDFTYKREKKNAKPYWSEVNKQGNDHHLDFMPGVNDSLFLNKTSSKELQEINKEKRNKYLNESYNNTNLNKSILSIIDINDNNLSKKHSDDVIELCIKIYNKLKMNLTEVIKNLKSHQIKGKNGKILDHIFLNILRNYGVVLSIYELPKLTHSFRVFGMPNVTDYVEFLQVCQLSKLSPSTCLCNKLILII